MQIDLDLYRREVHVSIKPQVHLSVVDIAPDYARRNLLFLHGFGGNAMQWQYQLDAFALTQRVIAPDLRGHGISDKPHSVYDMQELLGDIEAVLDTLGISEKVVLVGHSFGAALAAEFAITRPRRVEGVILIAGAAHFQINPIYRSLLKLPEKVLDALAPFVRKQLWAPPFVLKGMHARAVSTWDGPQRYPKILVPTLVIRGHNDRVFEKPQFEAVPALISQVEDIDVGASGHMVMLERSEAVNRAISRFLDADKRSWSQAEQIIREPQQRELLQQRPWLPHYDENVPQAISLPRAALPELLSATARRFPFKPAIIQEDRRILYRSLNRQANRFANALSQVGVKSGERIVLALPNLPQTIIAYYGTLKCGAVAALTLPDANSESLAAILDDTGARLLVIEKSMLPTAAAALRQRSDPAVAVQVIAVDSSEYLTLTGKIRRGLQPGGSKPATHVQLDGLEFLTFRDFIKNANSDNPPVVIQPKSLAVIQYTHGPAGRNVGVMLSHRNLLANILQSRHWIPDAVEGDERILCAVPILHSYGMTIGMNLSIALGGCLVLSNTSEAGHLLRTIQRHKPTIFPGVPKIFLAINDFPEVRKYGVDFNPPVHQRFCTSAGRSAGNIREINPQPVDRRLWPDRGFTHHPYEPTERRPQARQHRPAAAFHRSSPG